jgi:hypothetical protein
MGAEWMADEPIYDPVARDELFTLLVLLLAVFRPLLSFTLQSLGRQLPLVPDSYMH